jgi:hypothetical protein
MVVPRGQAIADAVRAILERKVDPNTAEPQLQLTAMMIAQ